MGYQIFQRSGTLKRLLKEYPYKLQTYTWLLLNGYIYNCRGSLIIDHRIEIKGGMMKLRKIKSEIIKSGDYTQFGQRARSCIYFHNNSKDWGTCGKEDEYSRCLCLSDMKCCFNGGQIIKELEK